MDWQGLLRKLSAEHAHEPQVLARIEHALRAGEEALTILASHGHRYHLADGPGQRFEEWPRKLFHIDLASNGRMIYSRQEAEDLGPGWFDSLARAQFWDGFETQFLGRGGVPKSAGALVVLAQPITGTVEEDSRRAKIIEDFLRQRQELPDAKQVQEAAQSDGGRGSQSEVCEESRDSNGCGQGLRPSGQILGKISIGPQAPETQPVAA